MILKIILSISLFLGVIPNHLFAMQPASLKKQATTVVAENIDKAELAKLKNLYDENFYNEIAKKALPHIAKSEKNIWEAVKVIKQLSNDTLNADVGLAGQLINILAEQYTIDFAKVYHRAKVQFWAPKRLSIDEIIFSDKGTIHIFGPETYILFAVDVLDTPGSREWIKKNPQGAAVRIADYLP